MDAKFLQQFCGTEERIVEIRHPFSRGDFTYACNGHVMVRVPRLADVGEVHGAPAAEKLFKLAAPADMAPLPMLALPPAETKECADCSEGEAIHDCPDCSCSCDTCGDKGEIEVQITCELNGAIFDVKYLRLLQPLPGVLFAISPPKDAAARFAFDGAEGLLMPCREHALNWLNADGTVGSAVPSEAES